MSFTDNEFNEQKSKLRIEAMEKEIQRLRTSSHKQTTKIESLRRNLYVQLVFFISLISILFFKGLILLPGITDNKNNTPVQAELTNHKDTLNKASAPVEDTLNRIIYNTHKGAIPKDDYDGIIFAIQIGAYTGIDLNKYEDKLLGINQDSYEGINQFTLGEFIDYSEAESFLAIVRQIGFNDAFIMSFKNGRRIKIQNALALRMKQKSAEEEVNESLKQDNTSDDLAESNRSTYQKESLSAPINNNKIQL